MKEFTKFFLVGVALGTVFGMLCFMFGVLVRLAS